VAHELDFSVLDRGQKLTFRQILEDQLVVTQWLPATK